MLVWASSRGSAGIVGASEIHRGLCRHPEGICCGAVPRAPLALHIPLIVIMTLPAVWALMAAIVLQAVVAFAAPRGGEAKLPFAPRMLVEALDPAISLSVDANLKAEIPMANVHLSGVQVRSSLYECYDHCPS